MVQHEMILFIRVLVMDMRLNEIHFGILREIVILSVVGGEETDAHDENGGWRETAIVFGASKWDSKWTSTNGQNCVWSNDHTGSEELRRVGGGTSEDGRDPWGKCSDVRWDRIQFPTVF
jgi:hypothetical protein